HPQPGDAGPDGQTHAHRRRTARADERQHLPLLGLSADRGRHQVVRGWARMRPFTYERATSAEGAVKSAAAHPNAKFLAGGTNLLDLMKLEIEQPAHLIDVGRLPLANIEDTPDGGLKIGAMASN